MCFNAEHDVEALLGATPMAGPAVGDGVEMN